MKKKDIKETNRKAKIEIKKDQKGITLLVLVITIIILLILAGITINAITGDNGIIGNAGRAKEEAEIANEKEILEKATVQAMGNNKYGNIEEAELQGELDKETGEGKTEATDIGDEFEVLFAESNRYYTVDKDGNVGDVQKIIKDEYPENITVGTDGKELAGNEQEPYQIWCIEDLVEWSQNYSNYMNNYINLERTLNFNSNLSYVDGKILGCNSVEELKDLLTNTSGSGFTPIANFSSTFNGQGYEIQNMYINTAENAGLFNIASGKIENVKISGNITSTENNAGGIVAGRPTVGINLEINKCENKAKVISSKKAAGGIAGAGEGIKITNCYNYGEIYSYGIDRPNANYEIGCAGGIVGTRCADIQDCGNEGKVSSTISAGGIIGYRYTGFNIVNCYNNGEINGTTYSGGIIGETMAGIGNIYNCYNTGGIYSDTNSGGIAGWIYYNTTAYIYNCCNMGTITGKQNIGGIIGRSGAGTGFYTQYMPIIKNTYSMPETLNGIGNISTSEVITSETNIENIINSLNLYINNTEDEVDKSSWKNWNINENNKICFMTATS